MLEAAILGGANDDDIEESVHHFISNLFRSNRIQTFLNCQTVDIMRNVKNNVNVLRYTFASYIKRNRYHRLRAKN
jgi:hypothetical protein